MPVSIPSILAGRPDVCSEDIVALRSMPIDDFVAVNRDMRFEDA